MSDRDRRRQERARRGSRRRRDVDALEAASQAEREAELKRHAKRVAAADRTPESVRAWDEAIASIRSRLPGPTFALWVEPLELAGELDGVLVATGPDAVVSWVQRRYGKPIGDAVRDAGDFRGVFVCCAPRARESEIL